MPRKPTLFALARAIDEERAARFEAALAPALAGEPGEAHALATLLSAAYPALAREIAADPRAVARVADEGFRLPRDRATLLARLGALAGPLDDGYLARLRRGARDERLRIALRELLPGSLGGADVDVTAREITALAEATIELALVEAMAAIEARFGEPRTAQGARGRFVVLGMGKLGGGELNAGSDVDLVYLYDTDDGEAVGPSGERTTLHEVWTRVARRLTASLEEVTPDGMLWRVDLRLRPEGSTGALVNSFAAAERYYESFGRLWERAALLRARPIAGELALGEEILDALAPFVWRRRVDPSIAAEMIELTRRARFELSRDPARDLKLGPGGIREAEFFVQTLQLVWGGREPRVRVKGTIEALRRLRARGLVTDREGRVIVEGYLALRRAEHAIQTATGLQTHSLPEAAPELERLARVLGFSDRAALEDDLSRHRARIATRFGSLAPPATPAPSRWADAIAALERGDRDAFADAIAREGLGAGEQPGRPSDLARALFDLSRHPDALLGARSRDLYPALAETTLDAVADAADPEQAALLLRSVFARFRRPGVYVALLGAERAAVRRLVETLGASAFIGEAVAHNPELGDLVLFARPLPTVDIARDEVLLATKDAASAEDAEDALVAGLRRAKARILLEVALGDLGSELDTREATRILSALADAELEAATRFSLNAPADEPVRGLAVLAMGKLGGGEIGYGSDLDVLFLFDPAAAPEGADPTAFYTRAARRIIRLVSISHPAGPGYELDTRLRPSGSQGLLVTSLEAFARYHGQEVGGADRQPPSVKAAIWEKMALLRARACAGDPALGAEAMRIARATAYARVDDAAAVAAEIHRLRGRMTRELSTERPGRHDPKLGRGGLIEIEFVAQMLQMLHGADPRVRTSETGRAIDALEAIGALAPEQAEALREGYRFLRRLEQRIRVVHADASNLLEERAPGLAPLARRMGIRDLPRGEAAAELVARYREVTARVRAVYDAVVAARVPAPEPSAAASS